MSGTVTAVVQGPEEEAEETVLRLQSAPESWDWFSLPKAAAAPDTRDPSLEQAELGAPGADRNPAVGKWSGEQLHSCRCQG